MPETKILSTHVPRSTGIDPFKPIHNSNQGTTAGAYVTASPAAGAQAQQYVQDTRQQMSVPPGYSPPGVTQSPRQGAPTQAARVQIVDRRPSAGVIRVGASSGMSDFSQPRVQILDQRGLATGAGHAEVGPGGVPLTLEEMMMVGFLANQFQQTAAANGDAINADLADRVLQKIHAVLQSQHNAAQPAPVAYAPPPATAPVAAPNYGPPQVPSPAHDQAILAHVEQALGHPQPSVAQPGYPQPGYPQPGYPQPGYPQPGYPAAPPVQVAPGAAGAPGVQLIGPTMPPSVQVFPSRPAAPRTAGTQAPVHVPPPAAYPGVPVAAYGPPVAHYPQPGYPQPGWGAPVAPVAVPVGPPAGLPWAPPAWMYPQAERVVVPPQETAPPVVPAAVGAAPGAAVAAGPLPAPEAPPVSPVEPAQVSQAS